MSQAEVLSVAEMHSAGRTRATSPGPGQAHSALPPHPAPQGAILTPGTAVAELRVALREGPWRIAAAWSLFAALLATGILRRPDTLDGPRLLLLFLLADPLWGGIWAALTRPETVEEAAVQARPLSLHLPYLQDGSPAARLLGIHGLNEQTLRVRLALPIVALGLGVAWVLGPVALGLTGLAIGASLGGRVAQRTAAVPLGLFHSLMAVALPWSLGLLLTPGGWEGDWKPWSAALLWTLLLWAGHQAVGGEGPRLFRWALILAQVGLLAIFVLRVQPLWVGLLTLFFLPTWWAVAQRTSLHRALPWWTLAMGLTGLGLGSP